MPPTKKRPGAPPGTLVYEGDEQLGPVALHAFRYGADALEEFDLDPHDVDGAMADRAPGSVVWLDVDGIHDVALVERLGAAFGLHPLTLEDVVSPDQRPKVEEYPDYVYLVLRMMQVDPASRRVEPEQVSIVFGSGFLLSFQSGVQGDVFDPVRLRLREGRGMIRGAGSDYLAYALLDVVVDHYMEILEGLGDHIEELEDVLPLRADPETLRQINRLRRDVLLLRRSVWPLRDVVVALERSDCAFLSAELAPYLRDVYDHTVRTVELIESAREMLAALVELHLSTVSNRMNEVMKVLTIFATFFLPLTFIAGIYGMNFNPAASPLNMPELNWAFGYPFAWAVMLATAVAMYLFFRRRGWL